MIEKLLALTDDDQPEIRRSRLESLHLVVLLTVIVELVVRKIYSREAWLAAPGESVERPLGLIDPFFPLALTLCLALLFFVGRVRRPASVAAAALTTLSVIWYLPASANHAFLMAIVLSVLALVDLDRPEDRRLALQALRWCWLIVFFVSGAQKLVYGLYLRGEFLTFMIAHEETFAAMFGWLLPAAELEQIRALAATGGPYLTGWTPLVAISNLVWVFEIAAPLALLYRPTRSAAVALVLLFVVAIELGAREIFFGLMAVNLTLLFARRDWIRRLLPVYVVAFALLILIQAGVLWPGFEFF